MQNIKALIPVLAISIFVFYTWRIGAIKSCDDNTYLRRVAIWSSLTILAFISPTFWIFIFLALFIFVWGAIKDENPVALYALLLHVIPPMEFVIPGLIVNKVFDLSLYRALTISIIITLLVRNRSPKFGRNPGIERSVIVITILMCLYDVAKSFNYSSTTNMLRVLFESSLDSWLIILAFVISNQDEKKLIDTIAFMVLGIILMAGAATFEYHKSWLLYTNIAKTWGEPIEFSWLLRDGQLRAQASAGHSIAMGYLAMLGIIFFTGSVKSKTRKFTSSCLIVILISGIIVPISRGPWIAGIIGITILALMGNQRHGMLIRYFLATLAFVIILFMSPFWESIVRMLPIAGGVDERNVLYRMKLIEVSVELIKKNILFGNPAFASGMEEMRQGQGIIDIVNVYLYILLGGGIIGLALFIAPPVIVLVKILRLRGDRNFTPLTIAISNSLVSGMGSTYIIFGFASYYLSLSHYNWMLIGISCCLIRIILKAQDH